MKNLYIKIEDILNDNYEINQDQRKGLISLILAILSGLVFFSYLFQTNLIIFAFTFFVYHVYTKTQLNYKKLMKLFKFILIEPEKNN